MKKFIILSHHQHGSNYFIKNLQAFEHLGVCTTFKSLDPHDPMSVPNKNDIPDNLLPDQESFINSRITDEKYYFDKLFQQAETTNQKAKWFGFKLFHNQIGYGPNPINLSEIFDKVDATIILERPIFDQLTSSFTMMQLADRDKNTQLKFIRDTLISQMLKDNFFSLAEKMLKTTRRPYIKITYNSLKGKAWRQISQLLGIPIFPKIPFIEEQFRTNIIDTHPEVIGMLSELAVVNNSYRQLHSNISRVLFKSVPTNNISTSMNLVDQYLLQALGIHDSRKLNEFKLELEWDMISAKIVEKERLERIERKSNQLAI